MATILRIATKVVVQLGIAALVNYAVKKAVRSKTPPPTEQK